jgi:hypothetical protein
VPNQVGRSCLVDKAVDGLRAAIAFEMKDLDGDAALDDLVDPLEDGAHATPANLAGDTVWPNRRGKISHPCQFITALTSETAAALASTTQT